MNHGLEPQGANREAEAECVLRGTCQGPMSAIVALLSNHGGPPVESFVIAPDLRTILISPIAQEHVDSLLASPDPPPPRA
jgi:hypothetical protein